MIAGLEVWRELRSKMVCSKDRDIDVLVYITTQNSVLYYNAGDKRVRKAEILGLLNT